MNTKSMRLYGLGLVAVGLLAVTFHYKVRFDWGTFWRQARGLDWRRIAAGTALVYLSVALRAFRWTVLLKPRKRVNPWHLVGPQFIGFTSVALFGSLADLVRPYLIGRRIKVPLSSLVATYTIERVFDIGAAALIFSGSLALSPERTTMPHREIFLHVGVVSLAATLCITVFAFLVRRFGGVAADLAERALAGLSATLAKSVGEKIRFFRDGLKTITSLGDLAQVLGLSLLIWGLIAVGCFQVMHAFVQTPELSHVSFLQAMLVVAASIGGSLVQLPLIGWFTQIGATAATMHTILNAPIEAATACGGLLLAVTFLFIIPAGILFAHFERISLSKVIQDTEEMDASTGVAAD